MDPNTSNSSSNSPQWKTVVLNGKRLKVQVLHPSNLQNVQIIRPPQSTVHSPLPQSETAICAQEIEPEINHAPVHVNVKQEDKFYWPPKSASMMLDIYAELKEKPEFRTSRQDKKLWEAVAQKLNEAQPPFWSQPVRHSQVKDKFTNTNSALAKKQDHNRQSGSDPKILTVLEEQLAEIKRKLKGESKKTSVAETEDCLNTALFPEDVGEQFVVSPQQPSFSQQSPVTSKLKFKPKAKHGSGSKLAQTKLQLETCFLDFMSSNKASDEIKNNLMERHIRVMEQMVLAKQKSNELKQLYMTNKTLIHQQKEAMFSKMYELKSKELEVRQRELNLRERESASTMLATQSFNNILGHKS